MKKLLFLLIIIVFFISCDIIFKDKKAECVIYDQITETEDSSGNIKFLGEIKNTGDGKALFVKITFTIKNSGGDIIGINFAYVNSTDLDPGQVSSFVCSTEVKRPEVDTWSYEITWNDED